MRNSFLLITILFLAFNLNAQITLTSSTCTPQPGDQVNEIMVPDFTFDISQSGPNVTWDFSSATGETSSFEYIDLSSSTKPDTFPLANIVADYSYLIVPITVVIEYYYSISDSALALEGEISAGKMTKYTDKKEVLKFPITYNDVFMETFSGTATETTNFPEDAQFSYTISGTIEISADAYGTLILPDTTVNDVLCIRTIYEYTDSMAGEYHEITDTITYWYDTIQSNPLVTTYISYINGNEELRVAYLINEFEVNNNQVNTSELELNPLAIYPNPANDFVIVENIEDTKQIDIYDIRGIRVKTAFSNDGKAKINLTDLSSGVYFITYIKDKRSFTKKMFVNK
jgi:hypothetical protein